MADVIDLEQRDEGMMVAHGICDQLDGMKHEYAGLPDFLTRVRTAGDEAHQYSMTSISSWI